MTSPQDKWAQGLSAELAAWEDWLEAHGTVAEERAFRLSSNRPFPWWIKPLIPKQTEEVRVLDVGAGLVSELGTVWEGREVEILAVDPLAESFDELLDRHGVIPQVRTIYGLGERLEHQFGKESFHFAFARNSIDRMINPIDCCRQLMEVLKPGCSLVMLHESNNGERCNYEGNNLWNFSVRETRIVVWSHLGDWDLLEELPHLGNYRIEQDGKQIRLTLTRSAGKTSAG